MEQYIPKAAVVAEIENIEADAICEYNSNKSRYAEGSLDVIHRIKHLLDAIEVKEADLESEIKSWLSNGDITDTRYDDYDDGDIERTAKHFFEIGLKAQKGDNI